ncbi:MAG TPA: hypothetical protein VGQ83_28250 [Polyangia bacterium]|jgi:hypothetical protein
MPRMTVYLPEDVYAEVKRRRWPVSELLQASIRRELEIEEKRVAADRLLRDLIREYGEPSPRDLAWAHALLDRSRKRARRAR